MRLYTIETGYFKLDGGAMFGVVPKTIWHKLNPADENNLCNWALRCLLIEDGNRLILVDTGIGDKQSEKFFSYYYLHGKDSLEGSLKARGFSPDDITDVILTHLHFDHCGGAISRRGEDLVPAFKNAIYWSHSSHWEWAVKPNEREKASFLKENILPIQESGQLKLFPDEGKVIIEFSDQIKLRVVNGHTRSMILPQIQMEDYTLVYLADLIPSTGHLPLPYLMSYDVFPLTTLQEKKSFLEEALAHDYVLFFEHDREIECCNLQLTERGIRQKDSFRLSDIIK